MTTIRYPEFGFYALPGHVSDPGQVVEEIRSGDEVGLGSVWLSERLNTKSVEVLSGVAAATSPNLGIASGLISNLPLRNPLVVAAYAATMMKLSGNRFALGIGRGVDPLADATGTPRLNFALLEDYVGVLRRLWRGETVDHSGPAGNFRKLRLGAELEVVPPIIMAAQGDRTCRWAGSVCDGVVYNSLWSARAVAHSTQQVREAARQAGRDPSRLRVWAILVTACEVSEELMLRYIVRRMNTYMLIPAQMEAFCAANGWDASLLPGIRAAMKKVDGENPGGLLGDENTTRDIAQLRQLAALYPPEWIREGNSMGSGDECARDARDRLDAGADGVLFHGTHPRYLAPLLKVWPKYRPEGRFETRVVNPGL